VKARSVGRRLGGVFTLLVTLLLLVAAIGVLGVTLSQRTLDDYVAFEPQRSAHSRGFQGLNDAEMTLRGYRLSGDARALNVFRAQTATFRSQSDLALRLTHDPQVAARLHEERERAERWLADYAAPLALTAPRDLDARPTSLARAGKELFDSYRDAYRLTAQRLVQLQQARLERADGIRVLLLAVAIATSVLAIAVAVGASLRTHRALVGPLDRLRRFLTAAVGDEEEPRADEGRAERGPRDRPRAQSRGRREPAAASRAGGAGAAA
jgi:CHASE3 domain sensor protein